MAKQATTIANQIALAVLDFAVEMCTRPWIVEPSRNSLTVVLVIFRLEDNHIKTLAGTGLPTKYEATSKDHVPFRVLYTDDAWCIFNGPKKSVQYFQ